MCLSKYLQCTVRSGIELMILWLSVIRIICCLVNCHIAGWILGDFVWYRHVISMVIVFDGRLMAAEVLKSFYEDGTWFKSLIISWLIWTLNATASLISILMHFPLVTSPDTSYGTFSPLMTRRLCFLPLWLRFISLAVRCHRCTGNTVHQTEVCTPI